MRSKSSSLTVWPLLGFCLAAGLLATLWGYDYASGNAEEQLPLIMRAMDPTYLSNDFFTNTFSLYGPRTFYSLFIAFLARGIPLTVVLFALTFLGNAGLAFFSSLTAQHFFKDSHFSSYLAAAGVLTLKTFWLGYTNILYRVFLEPAHLAMPLLLLGFYLILKRRYFFSALAFGLASLFHPLMGLETGWLLLGVLLALFLVDCLRKKESLKGGWRIIGAIGLLAAFSLPLLIPLAGQASISDELFIQLVAYVRHPHHYLPSTFGEQQYAQGVLYLLTCGVFFWSALRTSEELKKQSSWLITVGAAIFLLCVGGYLFVEVWPSRLWTSAQMFRLPYLIKWFSVVLISAWVGNHIESPAQAETRLSGFTAAISLVDPIAMALVAFITWFRRVVLPRIKLPARFPLEPLFLVAILISAVVSKPDLRTWALFALLFALIWIFYLLKWKTSGFWAVLGVLIVLCAAFLTFGLTKQAPAFLKGQTPVFSLYDDSTELAQVAEFARLNTPEDAVFLTPPKAGEFRYIAERAIVVDFTAFAFQDQAMLEWYTRMVNCYGTSTLLGFNGVPELTARYGHLINNELLTIARQYGADYALVFDYTNTTFPIVFTTQSFKLIKIPR